MDGQKNGQTNSQNYTNFERNLAMMVIYVPVKYEFDWTNRFSVRVRNKNVDRRMDKRTKNGQTNGRNFTNFKRNLAMMVIYVSVKYEFDWTNRFQLESGTKMWTNRWMDRQTDKNGQTNNRISPISKGT